MDDQPYFKTNAKLSMVNESINIFKGVYSLFIDHAEVQLDGNIEIRWLPSPNIRFQGIVTEHAGSIASIRRFSFSEAIINIPKIGNRIVLITDIKIDENILIEGIIQDFIGEIIHDFHSVHFSITNFINNYGRGLKYGDKFYSGRERIRFNKLEILIDKVPDYKVIYKELENNGGYCITHVGKISHQNGEIINFKDVKDVIDTLTHLLSFISGRQVGICHIISQKSDDSYEEIYRVPLISPWKKLSNWFPDRSRQDIIENLYPHFSRYLSHSLWGPVIKNVLTWDYDAHNSVYLENKILSVQVALETLAWTYLVEDNKQLSSKDFKRNTASKNFSILLNCLGIPIEIPNNENLPRENYNHGPHLFTIIRNAIVHPKLKDKDRFNTLTKYYTLQYGIQYLELSILSIVDYKGEYCNLVLNKEWKGSDIEPVPWLKSI